MTKLFKVSIPVTPEKTGVHIHLKHLDSGVRLNDSSDRFRPYYRTVKIYIIGISNLGFVFYLLLGAWNFLFSSTQL